MKHDLILAALAAVALGSLSSQALAQSGPRAECPPACRLDIRVPDDESRPPQINIESLIVSPGGEIDFGANKGVLIQFEGGQTPFVDQQGNPINTLTIIEHQPRRFRVRSQGNDCRTEPGCKYSVKALGPGNRPILDPYMIIK